MSESLERLRELTAFLAQEENVLWTLLEELPIAALLKHPGRHGTVIYVNPAWEEMWQIPRAEILSRPLLWLKRVHLADRHRLKVSTNGSFHHQTFRITGLDRRPRYLMEISIPVKYRCSPGIVARLYLDITADRFAEDNHDGSGGKIS